MRSSRSHRLPIGILILGAMLWGQAPAAAQRSAKSSRAAVERRAARDQRPKPARVRAIRDRILGPHTLRRGKLNLKRKVGSFLGALVGYAGYVGLRYPVRPYQSEVSRGLTRGSRLDERRTARLRQRGFRSVVSLTGESRRGERLSRAAGLEHLQLNLVDNRAPSLEQMREFLDFVTRPKNQPAYVHCQLGVGRTGVAVAVYRMAVQGWDVGEATAEARSHGLRIRKQVEFIRQFGDALKAGEVPGYPIKPLGTAEL